MQFKDGGESLGFNFWLSHFRKQIFDIVVNTIPSIISYLLIKWESKFMQCYNNINKKINKTTLLHFFKRRVLASQLISNITSVCLLEIMI